MCILYKEVDLSSSKLCACGESETMSSIVESCPINNLNGGIFRVQSADETAVQWLKHISRDAYDNNIVGSKCRMAA